MLGMRCCGSDHYPLVLTELAGAAPTREPRYIMERADWPLFTAMSSMQTHDEHLEIDTTVGMFNDTVRLAADVAIPAKTGGPYRSTIAWWNADCTVTRREKTRLYEGVSEQRV